MNYNEAKRALGVMSQFLRAFRTIDEVLETADNAVAEAKIAQEQEAKSRDEVGKILAETESIRNELATARQKRAEMIASMEAKAKEKYDGIVTKYQDKIASLEIAMVETEGRLNNATKAHETTMAHFALLENEAIRKVKDWETKLADAEKAYEKFKAKFG